ncbi:MAG: hypothetical protein ACRCZ2_13425, partial [Fusobacteriaceae bacterium]
SPVVINKNENCNNVDKKLYTLINYKKFKSKIFPDIKTKLGSLWEYQESKDDCSGKSVNGCDLGSVKFYPERLIKPKGDLFDTKLKENYLYKTDDCLLGVTVPLQNTDSIDLVQILPDTNTSNEIATEIQKLGGIKANVKISCSSKTILEIKKLRNNCQEGLNIILNHTDDDTELNNISGLKKFDKGIGIEIANPSKGTIKIKKDEGLYLNLYRDNSDKQSALRQDPEGLRVMVDESTVEIKANQISVKKCGNITNEYISLDNDYSFARRLPTSQMIQDYSANLNTVTFRIPIKIEIPNNCGKKVRGIITISSGTVINLASHKISIQQGFKPISGIQRLAIHKGLGGFDHICFGGIQVPSGDQVDLTNFTQYGNNQAIQQSITNIVFLDPNTTIEGELYIEIKAPNNTSLNQVKVPIFAEGGNFPITKWVEDVVLELSCDFKVK